MAQDDLAKARERVRVARDRAALARNELREAETALQTLERQDRAVKIAAQLSSEERDLLRKHLEDQ